ncbi:MAG TPA: TetR/AcrR family transcriptional regulator [Acidimicrobiia bacterium]|nr:TetR/AcrR family transcriptional regulator [Acidimicrobiia bacterium]
MARPWVAVSDTPVPDRALRDRGRRTRCRLLEAGVRVFAERNFHAARVDDIVKIAKTSHGTFYLYFSNKEDLFHALATDVAEQMIALAESVPAITADHAGYEALRAWLAQFSQLYEHYGPVIRAWTEAEIGNNDFGRLGADVLAEFTRVLAKRIQDHVATDLDAGVAALAVVAMVERCNYYVISGQVDITRKRMLDTLATATHAGLFGGDGHRPPSRS